MDAQKKAELEKAGINVDSALGRFMGNAAMLEKYLTRFLNEKSYAALVEAVKANDPAAAGIAVHTLKSVCGTIGCDQMHDLVVEQEKAIRGGQWEQAVAMMPQIQQAYDHVCAAIKAAQ